MLRVVCGNCVMTATGAAVGRFYSDTTDDDAECVSVLAQQHQLGERTRNWQMPARGGCVGVPSDVRIVVAALNSLVVVSG
jgi:hypothetical protein